MASANIGLNVTSDLFSLCSVKCENYSCVHIVSQNSRDYIQEGLCSCDLKRIKIGVDGKCESYRNANIMA